MKKGDKYSLIIIFLLVIITPIIFAQLSSSNYNITSYAVSSGGTNASSNNYKIDLMIDNLIGNITSSSYSQFLGFWYTVGEANTAPNNPSPNLVSLDGTNKTLQDLNCSAIITDDNSGDTLDVTVQWFKNQGLNLTIDYNNSYSNATMFSAILESENTTKTDNWTCGLRVYDGEDYSDWVNSSDLEILNTLPTVELLTPADNNLTTNRTPTFTWSGNDDDDDSLTYQLNLTCNPACSDDNRLEAEATTSHTIVNYLRYLSDNGFYYNWSVRASDDSGATYGEWATPRKIEIQSSVDIILVNDTVQFGSLSMDSSNDTSDDSPYPFLLRNDGNVFINVSINATDLWNTIANPSTYYKYKADNKTGEEGSFDWAQSKTSWQNMPNSTQEIAIVNFSWIDATDTAEVDLLVTVPSNEGSGDRESTVVFEASLNE